MGHAGSRPHPAPVALSSCARSAAVSRFGWGEVTGRQWAVLAGATFGYGFYYVCRLSLAVVKAPLVSTGVLTEAQVGIAGSALFFAYAAGKFANGVLADRLNLRLLLALGLVGSALVNLALGWAGGWLVFAGFAALWGLNGWLQSMGASACVVGITRWFEPRQRGTCYGLWSASHNLGEAITFLLTSLVVASWGWRAGFLASAAAGAFGVLLIWVLFRHKPLEASATVAVEAVPVKPSGLLTQEQLRVLRSPLVWCIASASAAVYVTRYAVNSWGVFYFHHAKGYTLVEAGSLVAISSVCGVIGTIASGWLSDVVFHGDRVKPSVLFGLLNCASLALMLLVPHGPRILDALSMVGFGLSIGSLVCLMGGLMAVDSVPRAAAGTALGLVGVASYIGAGIQDVLSGWLIGRGRLSGAGLPAYDFTSVRACWLAAALASVALTLLARHMQRQSGRMTPEPRPEQ